jgi:hypothetical protein
MTTETKKKEKKANNGRQEKKKSKIILFREKYPEGIGDIVNMRAVMR